MFGNIPQDIFSGFDILVVDDDPKSLEVVCVFLKHFGATVHTAENGQKGLEQVQALKPDFIMTDISMPVMDGWEFISHLKADRATADIPIIALTAHAMFGDREKALAAGCHNYLSKPLMPDTFIKDLVGLLADIPEFNLSPL